MSCREREDQIFLYAAGALDDEEHEALRAHLDTGCAACADVLARAEVDLAELAVGVEPVEPGADVRRRLLARVRAAAATPAPAPATPPARRRAAAAWLQLAGAAAAGAAAALLIASLATDGPAPPVADTPAPDTFERLTALEGEVDDLEGLLAEQDDEIGELEAQLAEAQDAISVLRSPRLVTVDLAGTELQPGARARVFWDWEDYSCYFHVENLARAPEGRRYALWLFTDEGETVLAGSFRADAYGEASFYALLPRDMGEVVRSVVTAEPEPPGAEPAGPVHLEDHAAL